MPASYVHELIARRAWDDFSKDGHHAELHLPALLAGAQGPDPFFFYYVLNRRKNAPLHGWATRLHTEQTDAFLVNLCEAVEHGDALARCFALGFLTHYATDSTAHPYVYAHSFDAAGKYRSNLHGDLEAAMDTYFYRNEGGKHTPKQMTGYAALSDGERVRIAQPFLAAITKTFDAAPTQEEVLTSFRDCVRYPSMLYSPHGIKRGLLSQLARCVGLPGYIEAHTPPARLPKEDAFNLAHMGWSSPWMPDTLRTESLPDLLDTAQQKSLRYIEAAHALWRGELSAGAFRGLLGGLGYDSGTAWENAFFFEDGQSPQEACFATTKQV